MAASRKKMSAREKAARRILDAVHKTLCDGRRKANVMAALQVVKVFVDNKAISSIAEKEYALRMGLECPGHDERAWCAYCGVTTVI